MTKILAIETSCDETAAAVTCGSAILSSIKVTQEIHKEWGGVVPSLARRDHEKNIDYVINKSLEAAHSNYSDIGAIAVTSGPGLAIALEVGIKKAIELAKTYNKPLIKVNHVEGHVLSPLIQKEGAAEVDVEFPCLGLVISGGHTQLIEVEQIGKYRILAQSLDDDIGEAIDKGARMLGLGYPGGPQLEKAANTGNEKTYSFPLPMAGREGKMFSYSGIKTYLFRLIESLSNKTSTGISSDIVCDLAAGYQAMIFKHLIRTVEIKIKSEMETGKTYSTLLVGGGVSANNKLRGLLESAMSDLGIGVRYPACLDLCTDNAAMIGVVGGFKADKNQFSDARDVDRDPRWKIDNL